MSNYTDFFPLATGGGGGGGGVSSVTSPDDLPLSFVGPPNTTYMANTWYQRDAQGGSNTNAFWDASWLPYRGIAAQTVSGTEYTLLNISGGGGYLCNVTTAFSAASTTTMDQKIVIIVDGTTYTYDYNPAIDSGYRGAPSRMLWGFFSSGNNRTDNNPSSNPATGMFGFGGSPEETNASLPPLYEATTSYSYTRIFSPPEFKLYNLPKLRFESSLVVKVTTSNLYTTSGLDAYGGATYYLDSNPL